MFREYPLFDYQKQTNPFQIAGNQSVNFYGNIGYPTPNYPVIMQQQYYDNYQYNKMFNSQVFAPHIQPIFIAGPIYKNSPIFYGPNYLKDSLLQPVEKKYDQIDSILENNSKIQSQKQTEENIKIRDQILDQWQFENEQDQSKQQKTQESKRSSQISLKSNQKSQNSQYSKQRNKESSSILRRKRGTKNLKIFFKAASFLLMYFLKMKRLIIKKREIQTRKDTANETINKITGIASEFMLNFLEQHLIEFWKKKDPLNWLENEQLSEKEKNQRINRVKEFIENLVQLIVDNFKNFDFQLEFIKFLAQISQNFEFPPNQYYFKFEIVRLEYTSFAALKNMNVPRQKMVLAIFFIVRVLAFTILYAPWTNGLQSIIKSPVMENNGLILASVLHELVLGEFREIPINENNQNHLNMQLRITQRPSGSLKDN